MSIATRLQALQPIDLGIPGPTSADMARAFRSVRADPLPFMARMRHHYGDVVSFPIPGPPALLLNDPADVQRVLQTSSRTWGKQTVQYAALGRVTGPGLLASSEPSWLPHRRMAAPAFHHERLLAVGDQVRAAADEAIEARLGDDAFTGAGSFGGSVVDVAALTHRIGLDAVGRALFSADLSGQAQQLLDATAQAADLVVRVGRSVVPSARWTPTRTNVRLHRTGRRLTAGTFEIIAQRRARGRVEGARVEGGRAEDGRAGHGDDLLGLLLDSGLSDEEIRDEVVTMVIAGHETVAAALAWTLMLLAEHPEVQERVRAEVLEHEGGTGPVPLIGAREQLPWTRAVVDEALRLYPPAWVISRRANAPDVIGGHEVPVGTLAIISPWLLHRRAEVWSDPLEFRPERFLGAGAASGAARSAYLPFGLGPRLCIGREFAIGEMVVVLASLLSGHRLSLPRGWARPIAEAKVAVHPRGGMPLVVTRLPAAAR